MKKANAAPEPLDMEVKERFEEWAVRFDGKRIIKEEMLRRTGTVTRSQIAFLNYGIIRGNNRNASLYYRIGAKEPFEAPEEHAA